MDEEVFNLSFGDVKVGNNRPNRVVAFVEDHPKAVIMAKGSTPSRTRLYQIGITTHWDEISVMMNVYGFRAQQWERFEKKVNYEAFLGAIQIVVKLRFSFDLPLRLPL